MPLDTRYAGLAGEPVSEIVEPRWAMNFAAGIGDLNPALYATDKGALPVHPLYLGYAEWEATKLLMREVELSDAERMRGVAAGLHQTVHRPIETGMRLTTVAAISGIQRHRAGALMHKVIETRCEGELVCATVFRSILRDVEVTGDDRPPSEALPGNGAVAPLPRDGAPAFSETIALPANLCHVYSECARAYNAIHTDIAVAGKAGLPGLILHGSATMSLAVSALVNRIAGGDVRRVRSLSGDYRAMVLVPGSIRVDIMAPVATGDGEAVAFSVVTDGDKPAIANGMVLLRPAA